MFKMKKEQDNLQEQEGVSLTIKELAQKVLLCKKKAEDQKQAIYIRIEELKKELSKPKRIKKPIIDSFSVEDIEKSVEPQENRQEIAHKITSLTVALELPIYCDKDYMDSIHEYFKAIRTRIEELEKQQYYNLQLKRQKEEEIQSYIAEVLGEYHKAQNEILGLLDVVHGLGWLGTHYNKLYNYPYASRPFTDIIDDVLKIEDGKQFANYISMH